MRVIWHHKDEGNLAGNMCATFQSPAWEKTLHYAMNLRTQVVLNI